MTRIARRVLAMSVLSVPACVQTPGPTTEPAPAVATTQNDTTGRVLVPPGYGTLRQDDISLHIDAGTVLVRALPLEESILRLLTPDSYRALRDLKESDRARINAISRRYGGRPVSVWLISFYGVEPAARFTPGDVTVTSGGREFRPYDILPLTVGFGEQRLRQRETQSAVYVYDGDIEVDQPVSLMYEGGVDDSWEDTLQRIERERAMVRARAGKPN